VNLFKKYGAGSFELCCTCGIHTPPVGTPAFEGGQASVRGEAQIWRFI